MNRPVLKNEFSGENSEDLNFRQKIRLPVPDSHFFGADVDDSAPDAADAADG